MTRDDHKPVLLVDSGNILFKKNSREKLKKQDRLAAVAILKMYGTMGYTAMAVGPRDLLDGLETVLDGLDSGTPWLSANLASPDGSPLFPPWKITEIAGMQIGIIGLTGSIAEQHDDFQVLHWSAVLPDIVDELSSSCDFLVLLSSMGDEENRAVAAEFPTIHLLLSADQKRGNMVPVLENNTVISQTHTRGKHLGSLDIDWTSTFWQDDRQPGSSREEQQLDGDGKGQQQEDQPNSPRESGGSSFRHRVFSLDSNIPESPRIQEIITTLKTEISR